jgi:hypothetical protein
MGVIDTTARRAGWRHPLRQRRELRATGRAEDLRLRDASYHAGRPSRRCTAGRQSGPPPRTVQPETGPTRPGDEPTSQPLRRQRCRTARSVRRGVRAAGPAAAAAAGPRVRTCRRRAALRRPYACVDRMHPDVGLVAGAPQTSISAEPARIVQPRKLGEITEF